ITNLSSEDQLKLLDTARQQLGDGLVVAARLIYKKLADHGNGQAAYELAQTFDPDFLKSAGIVGLDPDIDQARKWYQKAADMEMAGDHTKVRSGSHPH